MKTVTAFLLTALLLTFTPGAVRAADVAKIGVVDFQKILATSDVGKSAQADINEKGKKMESELKEKGSTIERQKESFDRESLVMTQEMRQEKERELREMIEDFKNTQKQYLTDFKEHEKRVVTTIRDDVLALVESLAKKEGYLMVLEMREAGVLYFPKSMDLTDTVIKSLNSKGGS